MMSPRWRKVFRDIWSDRTRTLLVLLSILMGIFSFGMVAGAREITLREMNRVYNDARPPSAMLVSSAFEDELVDRVRAMPEVEEAYPRRRIAMRIKVDGQWRDMDLFVLPDFGDIRVAEVLPESGAWPPPRDGILIERSSLGLTKASVGDKVQLETTTGEIRNVQIVGLAKDYHVFPAKLVNKIYATMDALAWLGEEGKYFTHYYNMLYVRVAENPYDRAHVLAVANQVRDLFEKDRHLVINFWLPAALGKNPAYDISSTIVLIMGALSLLIVFVSGFLVTSTVSALLARQTRQIGIMKAIGGDTPQIVGMYLLVILLIALVAVGIGVPLGAMGARAMSRFVGDFINFDIGDWSIPSYVYYVQAALGIGVPLLAGLAPVLAGSRITVLQAINDYGTSDGKRAGLVTRILQRVHGLPRPTMLSIRNTFRKKGRLALILITLSLGSGNFISVASVYASTVRTLDEASAFWRYDYEINLPAPRSAGRLMLEMGRIENVSRVEAWLTNNVYRERSDGTISENLQAIGLPPKTEAIYPVLLEGRWLAQDDTNAIVIDTNLLRNEPDIKLNDSVDLKIEGELTTWRVVGISRGQPGAPIAYMNYDHLVSLLPKSLGKANALRLTFANDLIEQDRTVLLAAIDKRTALIDVGVPTYKTVQQLRADSERQFNFILIFLLVMAILLAGVGMIGLTGTMSMNVIERTKEIGIMRAIGASNADIMNVFIVEGIVIATLAWLIGVALAVPVSRAMSDAVGIAFMRTPLSYSFSLPGVGIWIALMVALAALACFAPARAASSLTIREVLAYE